MLSYFIVDLHLLFLPVLDSSLQVVVPEIGSCIGASRTSQVHWPCSGIGGHGQRCPARYHHRLFRLQYVGNQPLKYLSWQFFLNLDGLFFLQTAFAQHSGCRLNRQLCSELTQYFNSSLVRVRSLRPPRVPSSALPIVPFSNCASEAQSEQFLEGQIVASWLSQIAEQLTCNVLEFQNSKKMVC